MKNNTTMERKSERELVITRNVNGPARLVFEAWTNPELFKQWWIPKSFGLTLLSYEADIRTGGQYRLVFKHGDSSMAFFGKYLEVTPHSRLVWTNEESDDGSVSTVTLEENGDETRMILHELYPSKEALEAAMSSGEKSGMEESFTQLEELLAGLGASVGQG
ncbi:MAG TPA: SRPBCC family protein [Thermoanaerobaculia bacterium]|nr:SRPBCC family protein [Thermoanaerobaculia bacterium]